MARPRSAEARQKVLVAATELALEVGVRSFTIDEVARRSGVAKTTIYRHFENRNQLLVTALDGVTPVPAIPDTGSLRTDLVDFLHEVRPIFTDLSLRALYFDIFAASLHDPELASLQSSMMQGRSVALHTIIERARERGELDESIDLITAFEIVEGPFIVRTLSDPTAIEQADIDLLVTRMMRVLAPAD